MMNKNNAIVLINESGHPLVINYTQIQGITTDKQNTTQVAIIVNGNEIKISRYIERDLLINRLNLLTQIDTINSEKQSQEVKELKEILLNPGRVPEDGLEEYFNLFFGRNEAILYNSFHMTRHEAKLKKFESLITINQEKIMLESNVLQPNQSLHKTLKV